MESRTREERLISLAAAIGCIIDAKMAMLQSTGATPDIAALACMRWKLTKAVCNFRWFLTASLHPGAGASGSPHARLIAEMDELHATLRAYVSCWSAGDNAARWNEYRTAAVSMLEDTGALVRRATTEAQRLMRR
ncbi:hypothetical protein [Sphingomonas sp. BK580]|uniref:hypothetical protein n=1 Tax=Sphingomonas sp. BK580 TaxID=2586972 RepID=UPI0016129EBD|nr:hypothetical protein [Sphingomonas sp. BK580]MBB3693440.1 hypothetical protein [Sphingomonas sp. BK580]